MQSCMCIYSTIYMRYNILSHSYIRRLCHHKKTIVDLKITVFHVHQDKEYLSVKILYICLYVLLPVYMLTEAQNIFGRIHKKLYRGCLWQKVSEIGEHLILSSYIILNYQDFYQICVVLQYKKIPQLKFLKKNV